MRCEAPTTAMLAGFIRGVRSMDCTAARISLSILLVSNTLGGAAGGGRSAGGWGREDHAARVRCPDAAGLHPGAFRPPPAYRERVPSTPPACRPALTRSRRRSVDARAWRPLFGLFQAGAQGVAAALGGVG